MILMLIGVFALDADAQECFDMSLVSSAATTVSADDAFSMMLKKRKKKRRKSKRRGKGRGSDVTMMAGGGLYLGLPMGEFGKSTKMGMGLNLDADYFVMPELALGVSTGLHSFKYKTDFADDGSFRMIPFMLKGSYYFMEDQIRPYVGLGLGLNFDQSKFEYTMPHYFINPVTSQMDTVMLKTKVVDKTTDFGLTPMAGVVIGVSDNLNLHFNAKYEMFFMKNEIEDKSETQGAIGLNLGLLFSF